ncbi:MAG: DUF3106 domain-containing protein, partial [Steroidobacteraceae bacterium]
MDNKRRPVRFAPVMLAMCALLLGAAPVLAQEPPPVPAAPAAAPAAPVPWSNLSPEQQRLLGPVASQWNSLPPARQQALARGSERWMAMSPAERD